MAAHTPTNTYTFISVLYYFADSAVWNFCFCFYGMLAVTKESLTLALTSMKQGYNKINIDL